MFDNEIKYIINNKCLTLYLKFYLDESFESHDSRTDAIHLTCSSIDESSFKSVDPVLHEREKVNARITFNTNKHEKSVRRNENNNDGNSAHSIQQMQGNIIFKIILVAFLFYIYV